MSGIVQSSLPLFSQLDPSARTSQTGAAAADNMISMFPGPMAGLNTAYTDTDVTVAATAADDTATELFAALLQQQLAPATSLASEKTLDLSLADDQKTDGMKNWQGLLANLIQIDHSTQPVAGRAADPESIVSDWPALPAADQPNLDALAPESVAGFVAGSAADSAIRWASGMEQPQNKQLQDEQLQNEQPGDSQVMPFVEEISSRPQQSSLFQTTASDPSSKNPVSAPGTPVNERITPFSGNEAKDLTVPKASITRSEASPEADTDTTLDPQTLATLLAYYPPSAQTAGPAFRQENEPALPLSSRQGEFGFDPGKNPATGAALVATSVTAAPLTTATLPTDSIDHLPGATASFAAAASMTDSASNNIKNALDGHNSAASTENPETGMGNLRSTLPESNMTATTTAPFPDTKTPASDTRLAANETGKTTLLASNSELTVTGNTSQTSDFARLLASQHPASVAAMSGHTANPTNAAHMAAASQTSLPVEAPLNSPRWPHEINDKLVWMVNRHEQRAELVLNPPQLGRIEVSLNITHEQTHAHFVATNPEARAALENALPRLREMFAEAGLSLGQAQVGAESQQQAGQMFENPRNRADSGRYSFTTNAQSEDNMPRTLTNSHSIQQGRGLVDVFA